MIALTLGKLSLEDIQNQVQLTSRGFGNYAWLDVEDVEIGERDQLQLQVLQERLFTTRTQLLNEATTWPRGIYPLLLLAEQERIQAWA